MSDDQSGFPDVELRERLAHIDQLLADHDRKRQEVRLAPWLAVFAGLTAGAALLGAGAAIGWFGARSAQQISVHLDSPLVIQQPTH